MAVPLRGVELDEETFRLLKEQANAERRPVSWQAEVLIRRAVGLPFPIPASEGRGTPVAAGGGELAPDVA